MNTNPTVRVKRSLVSGKVPEVSQLGLGELAINHYDGKLFIRQDTLGVGIGTTVVTVNGQIGPQGAQGFQGKDGGNAGKIFYFTQSQASDLGNAYKKLLESPSTTVGITSVITLNATEAFISEFVTEPNVPGVLSFPAGNYEFLTHASVSAGSATFRAVVEKCAADGTGITTILNVSSDQFSNTTREEITWTGVTTVATASTVGDRFITKLYATRTSGPTNITLTVNFEDQTQSYLKSTISAGAVGAQGTQGRQGTQGQPGQRQAVQELDRRRAHQARRAGSQAGRRGCRNQAGRQAARSPAVVRLHAGRRQVLDGADGRQR